MVASYKKLNPKKLDIRFVSLYRDEQTQDVNYEMKNLASELTHNAIMQEFDAIYDREQSIIYGEWYDFGNKIRTKKMIMKDLQDSMKKKLDWLNCRVSVVDSDTYNTKIFQNVTQ